MNKLEAVKLALLITQTGILLGLLYVIWWGVNHGIYPIMR